MYNYFLMAMTDIRSNEELKKIEKIREYIEWLEENMYKMPNERRTVGELKEGLEELLKKMVTNEMTTKINKNKKMYMNQLERVEKSRERLMGKRE